MRELNVDVIEESAERPTTRLTPDERVFCLIQDVRRLAAEVRRLRAVVEEKDDQIHFTREVRDDLAEALHELECGWWAVGDVPEMMEAVRLIVRGTVDRATEGGPWGSPDN